jgi:glycerophosphoryl diester phosphodiesterase
MNTISQKIIAHRGECFDAPENTLASINLAWGLGAEAVEIDIQLSKDNRLVVIHDTDTLRIGGRNKKVAEQTLEELRELDYGIFKDLKYKAEAIPTLEQVLKTIPSSGKLVIEIKCGIEILPYLKLAINETNLRKEQIEIIAFDYEVICEVKRIMPEHKALWLLDLDYNGTIESYITNPDEIIEKTKNAKLDGIDIWAGKVADNQFIKKIKESGLLLYFWTVDSARFAKDLLNSGADGITTNRASWLKNELVTNG